MLKKALVIIILLSNIIMAQGQKIVMSFGENIPPYTFPETNSGLEVEVIREALAFKGHVLIPEYYPLARVPLAFKDKWVDAATTDLGEDLRKFGGHYAQPAVWFDNVFITLKENNVSIKTPKDLKKLSVLSFQGAIKRYPKWLNDVAKEGNYYEQNNQEAQVLSLDKKRVEVILSDSKIFKYFTLKLKKEKKFTLKEVEEHHFVKLDIMDYRPIFRDEKIRDHFNEGLKHIKIMGKYDEIFNKYLKE